MREPDLPRVLDEALRIWSAAHVLRELAAAIRRRTWALALGWQTCATADWMRSADDVEELGAKLPSRLQESPRDEWERRIGSPR